ncbi:ABC transporter ATP-binding protein [Clostridium grantii]|uniref:ABC-2 type transport system ATP-binding protein n=1 Tax=Clostridium grantii DSM 8605 TaxID=1121316 RepID=A0A1M5S6D7_9CLOT|nr:ABC-2 type transport system ATP-binding protein [Clostridium grantii DSM 8605]
MIELKNLTQVYKSGKGIFDVNFSVKEGEVFGYLGPNGAGKTTTIRNLLGFANASEGSATINGLDCRKDAKELQNIIGYLPGEMALFDNMTGMEFLKFMTDMRKTKDVSRRDELIERFQLDTKGKIKKMSKGMKQKLGIITAFMHEPEVYILDEPTSGLDPFMQNIFLELVQEEKKKGKTILMSSHIFEEIHRSCDRAVIIREGKIVAIEDVKALDEMKAKTYVITLGSSTDAKKVLYSDFETKKISDDKVQAIVKYPYNQFFWFLSTCDVTKLEVKQESLEDVFMKYYGEDGHSNE